MQRYELALQKANAQRPMKAAAIPGRGSARSTASALAQLFQNVRIFHVPMERLRLRAPETPLGWAALLLPVPFGMILGMLRRMRPGTATVCLQLLTRN
jgi:hypothetical protein